jgi:transposase
MKTSGLDVHKDSIFCAIYDGKSYSTVKEFSTTTISIRELVSYLQSEKVKKVAMESTSTYWVPVWDILWEMGFDLKLVNPLHIKQLPGRKSDAKDAQWIAELLHKHMLRGSLVPTGVTQLHPRISHFSESAQQSFDSNGQDFGHVWHPFEQLHQQP